MGEFRQLLEAGDVSALRSAWHRLMPQFPQPETVEGAEIAMHMARTAAESVTLKARAYSHRWLMERNLPSQLPDVLKPKAERLYPVIAEGVFIAVETQKEWLKPAMIEVRGSMEYAVNEVYADGKVGASPDPTLVKSRMEEARAKTMKALFGGTAG